MFNSENAQKKWAPLLDHADCAPIKDTYRRAVTAALLENQEKALREEASHSSFQINEANDTVAGDVSNFDPVLIALVRRAMPSLIAYDVAGVQPMSGPTGLIFSMVAKFGANRFGDGPSTATTAVADSEALFSEAPSAFSGDSPNIAKTIAAGESVADGGSGENQMSTMGFDIRKATVTAGTRALKAGYTMELAQDLKAIHGLDAEAELANILSTEILAEINREMIIRINAQATTSVLGSSAGNFQGGSDADNLGARWAQEKFQSLVYRIDKEANAIGVATRRGKGNFVIVSPDVGSALAASGYLQYGEALEKSGLNIDAQVNTFAGTLNGSLKVYVDPYQTSGSVLVGYRGANPYDAGIFYCPYVPLTMVKAVGETDFQPRIAFKTRYGMVANPYALDYSSGDVSVLPGTSDPSNNPYFRKFTVSGL
jgi:hypothetical protein